MQLLVSHATTLAWYIRLENEHAMLEDKNLHEVQRHEALKRMIKNAIPYIIMAKIYYPNFSFTNETTSTEDENIVDS